MPSPYPALPQPLPKDFKRHFPYLNDMCVRAVHDSNRKPRRPPTHFLPAPPHLCERPDHRDRPGHANERRTG